MVKKKQRKRNPTTTTKRTEYCKHSSTALSVKGAPRFILFFLVLSSDFVTEYIAKCDDKGLEKKKEMKEYAGSLSFLLFLMCEKTKERKENKQQYNNTALL